MTKEKAELEYEERSFQDSPQNYAAWVAMKISEEKKARGYIERILYKIIDFFDYLFPPKSHEAQCKEVEALFDARREGYDLIAKVELPDNEAMFRFSPGFKSGIYECYGLRYGLTNQTQLDDFIDNLDKAGIEYKIIKTNLLKSK